MRGVRDFPSNPGWKPYNDFLTQMLLPEVLDGSMWVHDVANTSYTEAFTWQDGNIISVPSGSYKSNYPVFSVKMLKATYEVISPDRFYGVM